jgi:beta-phosphoglucomutase-like phosphatase (HAD superfamily)
VGVPTTGLGTQAFWWDRGRPADAAVEPLRAVIFNLDGALADIERDAHRVAFNEAFAVHGLDLFWDVDEYGRLMRIGDERRRIAAGLRRRGFGRAGVEIAAYVHRTKTEIFANRILDGDVSPRPGLVDLVTGLFVAGTSVAVVSTGSRWWAEPLVKLLIGDGIAETIVTRDDLVAPGPDPDVHGHALWELGVGPESALAVEGSVAGFRAAVAAKLATVVLTTAYTAGHDFTGAAAVRSGYDGAEPLLASTCARLHRRWWTAKL